MDFDRFLPLVIGAIFGAAGWLVVGMFLSRRDNDRRARNAARAVYFELVMNEIDIDVATSHGVYGTLRRGAFDRLLPELATWLEPDELETIVRAYMSHAGYEQAQRETQLPASVKQALLARVLSEHEAAVGRSATARVHGQGSSTADYDRRRCASSGLVGARSQWWST